MTAPRTQLARVHGSLRLTQAPHRPSWKAAGEADGYCELRVEVTPGVLGHTSVVLTEAGRTGARRATRITLDPAAARVLARYILDGLGPE